MEYWSISPPKLLLSVRGRNGSRGIKVNLYFLQVLGASYSIICETIAIDLGELMVVSKYR